MNIDVKVNEIIDNLILLEKHEKDTRDYLEEGGNDNDYLWWQTLQINHYSLRLDILFRRLEA
jgi:hypothetical protein